MLIIPARLPYTGQQSGGHSLLLRRYFALAQTSPCKMAKGKRSDTPSHAAVHLAVPSYRPRRCTTADTTECSLLANP